MSSSTPVGIKAAWITAGAIFLAAVVTGLFTLLTRDTEDSNLATQQGSPLVQLRHHQAYNLRDGEQGNQHEQYADSDSTATFIYCICSRDLEYRKPTRPRSLR